MKKLFTLLLLTLLPLVASATGEVEVDGIYYYFDNSGETKTAEVRANPNKYTGDITILATVTYNEVTYDVTSIGSNAFQECVGMTSVTIPNSVTSIGNYAFSECSGLTSVTIPNSVTSIGNYAFSGCSGLTSVTIPNSVTSIGGFAFSGCSGLTSVSIPNSVTSIGLYTFSGCTELESLTIGTSVSSIGDSAFYGCNSLTFVTIPDGVLSIGEYTFSGCSSLCSISIPASVNEIGNSAFSACSSLISVVIPKGVTKIESGTFKGCTSLISVELPDGITSIGSSAFQGCNSLTNLNIPSTISSIESEAFRECNSLESFIIPEGVTEIGKRTFWHCNKLKSITIPKSITSIGEAAFSGCGSLKEVHISDIASWCNMKFNYEYISLTNPIYYAQHLFLNDQEIKDLVIPETVTSIVKYAFYGCKGLNSVTIPNSITSIDVFTFSDCSGLKSIILPENLTLIRGNAFQNCSSLESVTIPSKVEYIYQEAFAGCKNLKSVKSLAATPPFLYDNSFSNYEIPLSVPEGTRDTYLATSPWNKFKEILSGSDTKYTLTYKVDGEVYKTYELYEGETITPEPDPTKEGYDFSGWSTIPATMPAEDVTVTGSFTLLTNEDNIKITSAGQSTWCSKYDLDFTGVEGLKAYIASGYDRISGTIWLTRVYQVPANEGIFLMGNAGDYKVPHISTGTYYANLLVGTLQSITLNETDGEYTNYYLSNGDSGVGFYKVNGSVDLKANRAYLPLLKGTTQAGTRFIGLGFEDDGTTNLTPALSKGEGEGAWYTLQGQRVAKPGKGLYIRNGKKVVKK